MNIFSKDKVKKADLIVDAIYEGSERGELKNEPISTLLGVGNSGGLGQKNLQKSLGLNLTIRMLDYLQRLTT